MVDTYVGTGLAGLPLTYTLENDTDYDRIEVVGLHAGFPDGINSIDEPELIEQAYLYLDGGRETIGFGQANTVGGVFGPTVYARRWDLTIPWVASLNAITAGSGNIQPGSCKLYYYTENNEYIEVYDTPTSGSTGQWTYSSGGVSYITASSINYTTGVISITFAANRRPAWGETNKASGKPVRMTYNFANPVKYPTQWLVTRTWPSGRVRQAKAWIGQSSGEGVFVSRRIQTHAVYSDAAGTQIMPKSALWPTPIDQLKEYTRVYLRVGLDDGTVNSDLPTYTLHADTASALNSAVSSITSQIYDHNNSIYYARLLSASEDYNVHVMEDPSQNSGKGWCRVYQKRGYHLANSNPTFGSMTRDFLSITSYFYVPHNSRHFDVEVRLGNDYQGYDPLDHTINVTLGTGNGSNRSFSTTAVNRHGSSSFEDGPMRQGKVWVYINGVPVAHDRRGDGVLRRITGRDIVNLNSTTNNYGSVVYSTGAINVNVPSVDPAPAAGAVVTCSYGTRALRMGTVSGAGGSISSFMLPSLPNQRGVHIRVGSGSTALHEAWDAGGVWGGSVGYLAPLLADSVVELALVTTGNLTTSETGTLATNLHPGSVEFFVSATTDGLASTYFCRDNGNGGLTGRNVSAGSINYATGDFSITFSTTPPVGHNLYANYKRSSSQTPVSGTVDYTTGEVNVTVHATVPSNTPVYVSYIRNEGSLKTIDPNAYPLGSAGFARWLMLFNTTYLDMECEAAPSYAANKGANFITMVGPGSMRDNITPSSNPEYLHDGASLPRLLRLYAKNNATSDDNNVWEARKIHPLTPIPTIECYNASLAYGTHEGTVANITPEQRAIPFYVTSRAFTEDIGRKKASPAIIHPFPFTAGGAGNGVNTSQYSNKSHVSGVDSWNGGNVFASGSWPGSSVRNNFGWIENFYNGVNAGGAGRVGQDFAIFVIHSQSWQMVSYLYHSSLFPAVRPGAIIWNVAFKSKWEDRAYRNYIGTGPSSGAISNITGGVSGNYGQSFGSDFIGRAHKACWSNGTASVTNGSTTVVFSTAENVQSIWNWVGFTQTATVNGSTTRQDGLRRIALQGSTKTYTLTNVSFNSSTSRWVGTLDSAFVGATQTAAKFGLFNDVRPGTDLPFVRTNPTLASASRLGCGVLGRQHSIEGDSSSHQAAFTSFDVWSLTGRWMAWDVCRHHAEWNMASCKQYNNWEFQQDQMRTSAWHLRSVMCGYAVTANLTGRSGFEFLTDSLYGGAKDRYREWIKIRLSQWVDYGARGEMDPTGHITAGGRSKIVDLRVSSSSDKADWYRCSQVGNTSPTYGGTGALTECQKLFSATGFHYVSIWEIGYLAPWAFAAYREFRNDAELLDLPSRGQVNRSFGEIVTRIFDAYSKFFVDYAYIDRLQSAVQRGAPGFYQTALASTPGYFGWGPIHGGNQTYWSLPTQWLAHPVDSNGTLRWEDILPQYINKTVTFSAESRDDDYIAVQIYWLRGASYDYNVSEPVDRLGHPLVNQGWLARGWSSDSNTTFELSLSSSDSSWHHPGVPFAGNALIPGVPNSPSTESYPGVRAPLYPEAFNLVGISHDNGSMLSTITFLFTSQVARFHPDPTLRARAGLIMNKYLTQAVAMSLITNNRYNSTTGVAIYNKGGPIEINHYAGPISGSYPYSTDSGTQPVDRWWDESYRSRRRLVAGTSHSDLDSGISTFQINLSDYGVDDKALSDSTEDVRVVLQYDDGSYVVCQSVVRQNSSGDFIMFVQMPVDLTDGQGVSGQSTSLAWYIYYTSLGAGPAVWESLNAPQAPYARDGATRILWNQNGNYATDASSNDWSLTTIPGLDPAFSDGPVGGAIQFSAASLSTAFSPSAADVAKSGSPSYLSGNFTVEFNLRMSPVDAARDAALNYGVFSLADDAVYPMIAYVENAGGGLVFLTSLGSSGGGYGFNGASILGQFKTAQGGTNSVTTVFSFSLGHTAIKRGSVRICLNNGSSVDGKDDGSGALTGTGISSGTINYSSGAVSVTFSAAPATGSVITVFYSTDASPNRLQLGEWNHVRIVYNGTAIVTFLDGAQVGSVPASGQLQPLTSGSATVFNLGSLFNPSILWTARSNIQLAEFRVSSVARGAPAWISRPLSVSLLAEETQVFSGSATVSATCFIATPKTRSAPVVAAVAVPKEVVASAEAYLVTSVDAKVEAPVVASLQIEVESSLDEGLCSASIIVNNVTSQEVRCQSLLVPLKDIRATGAATLSLPREATGECVGELAAVGRTGIGNCAGSIVVVDNEVRVTCAASIQVGGVVEVAAPAAGSLLVRSVESSASARADLALPKSVAARTDATLVVNNLTSGRLCSASVVVTNKEAGTAAQSLIAGINESYVQAVGLLSHFRQVAAPCSSELIASPGVGTTAPCAASIVVLGNSTYTQGFATVATSVSVAAPCAASIGKSDQLSSSPGNASLVLLGVESSATCEAGLIARAESSSLVDATLSVGALASFPVAVSLLAVDRTTSVTAGANIAIPGSGSSATAQATLAVARQVAAVCETMTVAIKTTTAVCASFIKLEDLDGSYPATATLAIRRDSSGPVDVTLATISSRSAVCRASLVLPLEQNLNAGGVDYSHGGPIND